MKSKNKLNKNTLISLLIMLSACQVNNQALQSPSKAPIANNSSSNKIISNNSSVTPAVATTTPIQINQSNNSQQDEEAIKQIIKNNPDYFPQDLNSTEEYQATVPNNGGVVFATVPNNGGVVFMADPDTTSSSGFATKALFDNLKNRIKSQIKDTIKNAVSAVIKRNIGQPIRDYKIQFNKDKTQAEVKVITTFLREIILNRKVNPLSKKINEESVIKSVFIKEDGAWKISQIAPIESKTSGETETKIKLESVKLTVQSNKGKESTKTTELDLYGFKNKSRLLSISKGDIITLEAKVTNGDLNQDKPLQVFARLANTKVRVPMYDDGGNDNILDTTDKEISGDSLKNDDVYTVNMVINNKKDINYLIIDVLIPLDENSKSIDNFNYISKSIPISIM